MRSSRNVDATWIIGWSREAPYTAYKMLYPRCTRPVPAVGEQRQRDSTD